MSIARVRLSAAPCGVARGLYPIVALRVALRCGRKTWPLSVVLGYTNPSKAIMDRCRVAFETVPFKHMCDVRGLRGIARGVVKYHPFKHLAAMLDADNAFPAALRQRPRSSRVHCSNGGR